MAYGLTMQQAYHFMSFGRALLRIAVARSLNQTLHPTELSNQNQDVCRIQALMLSACRDYTTIVFDRFSNLPVQDCTKSHRDRPLPTPADLCWRRKPSSRLVHAFSAPRQTGRDRFAPITNQYYSDIGLST
jgi:hypothetical protein